MTQEANTSSLRIEIFGQVFNLACASRDPDYILKLAEYVDSRMRALAETNTVDNFSLAVLSGIAHCRRMSAPENKAGRRREGKVWRRGSPDDRRRQTARPREAPTTPHAALVREAAFSDRQWRTQPNQGAAQGAPRLWQDQKLESSSAGPDKLES